MISVCMATYNGEQFIRQQIDSILCQLDDQDELIISDDGSTDKTLEIIQSYKNPQIVVLHHKKNEQLKLLKMSGSRFASDNFQNTLKSARGEYIFLADQDDVWEENKKEIMLKSMQIADIAVCNASIIDKEGNTVIPKVFNYTNRKANLITAFIKPQFSGCCMLINRKLLAYIMPFPYGLLAHDIWIGIMGMCLGKLVFIDMPLHRLRRHLNNVSFGIEKSKNTLWYKIWIRIILGIQIVSRISKCKFFRKL